MLPHTRSRRFLFACALSLGVLLLLPTLAAALVPTDGGSLPGTETRITTSMGDEYDPALSGDLISYTSYRGVDTDVWYYDLASGLETQMTSAVGNQELSDVRDGLIVYTDLVALDIMLYDPATALTTNLTPERLASINSCIGDGLVAWEDMYQGNQDVYAKELATGELRRLTDCPAVDAKPASDGETIVWESCAGTTCAVRAYDWATATLRSLTADPASDYRRPDISGDRVVFDGLAAGERDIYAHDLATDAVRRLELPGVQVNANVSGDYVCFEDVASGVSHIGIWDLKTDTVYRMPASTPNPYGQILNDVDGNRIVYTDDRDRQLDIYTYVFDVRPPTITVNCPLEGAVFTEFDAPVADWSASDDFSGVASSGGSVASGEPLDMTPGSHTVTFWAEDGFGNRTSVERTYVVRDVAVSLFPADSVPLGDVTVGQAVTQIVTATNSGEVPLWITAAVTPGTPAAFSVSGGGAVVNPGQTLDLTVRFAPTAAAVLTGALRVVAADAVTRVAYPLGLADIVLTGRGVSSELPPQQAAQKLLLDYNAALANGTLAGSGPGNSGPGRAKALGNMIEAAGDYIARGDYARARSQLADVIARCDGLPKPPEFVAGPAREGICEQARALLTSIGG